MSDTMSIGHDDKKSSKKPQWGSIVPFGILSVDTFTAEQRVYLWYSLCGRFNNVPNKVIAAWCGLKGYASKEGKEPITPSDHVRILRCALQKKGLMRKITTPKGGYRWEVVTPQVSADNLALMQGRVPADIVLCNQQDTAYLKKIMDASLVPDIRFLTLDYEGYESLNWWDYLDGLIDWTDEEVWRFWTSTIYNILQKSGQHPLSGCSGNDKIYLAMGAVQNRLQRDILHFGDEFAVRKPVGYVMDTISKEKIGPYIHRDGLDAVKDALNSYPSIHTLRSKAEQYCEQFRPTVELSPELEDQVEDLLEEEARIND